MLARRAPTVLLSRKAAGFSSEPLRLSLLNDDPVVRDELGAPLSHSFPHPLTTLSHLSLSHTHSCHSLSPPTFSSIAMRKPAVLEVPLKELVAPVAASYEIRVVDRSTVFTCLAGLPIYVLSDPSNKQFVMQAYSIEVKKEQTYESLASLGSVLSLPEGWSFEEVVLTQDLEIPSNGVAQVVQDEFKNTYQFSTYPIV